MAAPPEKTLKDLNGKWVLNKSLSDDYDRILEMQGVPWWLRKAISYATVTLTISQYISDTLTHIDILQVATGGVSSTNENRTLDWQWRDHTDKIFGTLKGRSRWVKLGDVDDDKFLKEGWDDLEGEHVQSYVENGEKGWTADQVWGFESVGGERRYVRHVVVRKGEDWKQARLVYDYKGAAEKEEEVDEDLAYE